MTENSNKTSRNQWFIAIGGFSLFIALLVFGMWVSDPNKGKPSIREQARMEREEVRGNYKARSVEAITPEEQWISKSEKELAAYKVENRQLKQNQQTMEKKLAEIEKLLREKNFNQQNDLPKKSAATLPPPPNPKSVNTFTPGNNLPNSNLPPRPGARPGVSKNSDGSLVSSIQVFEFDDSSKENEKDEKTPNISHALPTGAFSKVVLLSGADAPTGGEAQNNPVPVLMRLIDHGTLPNYFNSEIKDCHVTGAMRGDLSSERGKVRTERLSCVLINGDIVDVRVKGWINGEDGKEGFRGRVVEKSGALLARSFVAGTFSGIGDNVSSQYQNISQNPLGTVTTIDPGDVGKAGLASGLSTSSEKLADYYIRRANEMYPIVEVNANRIGELVIQELVDFERNVIGNMGVQ